MREVRYREARERAQGPRLATDQARMAAVKCLDLATSCLTVPYTEHRLAS